jgi:hypothetical protein
VAGEGVDMVLLLEEGTREVRCGPKGADEGGTGELTERGENGGVAARKRRGGAGPVGRARTQGHGERGGRVIGVLGRAREGGREWKEKGGSDGVPHYRRRGRGGGRATGGAIRWRGVGPARRSGIAAWPVAARPRRSWESRVQH